MPTTLETMTFTPLSATAAANAVVAYYRDLNERTPPSARARTTYGAYLVLGSDGEIWVRGGRVVSTGHRWELAPASPSDPVRTAFDMSGSGNLALRLEPAAWLRELRSHGLLL